MSFQAFLPLEPHFLRGGGNPCNFFPIGENYLWFRAPKSSQIIPISPCDSLIKVGITGLHLSLQTPPPPLQSPEGIEQIVVKIICNCKNKFRQYFALNMLLNPGASVAVQSSEGAEPVLVKIICKMC